MNIGKILIAFDGSENSRRAVAYTAAMTGGGPERRITVAAIERPPDRDLYPDDASWKEECARRVAQIHTALDDAKDMLQAAGIPAARVETQFVESCRSPLRESRECSIGTSIALEILRLAEEGGYGTLVVGRRGVSKQEEFLFGSVSTKIIQAAKGLAVWVVA
ncbi:MAG: universal stress protein [Solidesulfovibrio sp.]|uniref:universal stress protein n=1 Tax=Solidesulfovibrio sp. TaxID=2910990 RepID=UPI002B1EB2EC|nr:universal stress protein [Solidesulfovibrio sp.]MEA4855216.1 universal stress protein [Solidesulfovibrio sp.]